MPIDTLNITMFETCAH